MSKDLLLITHCLAGIGMIPSHLLMIAMTVWCTCRLFRRPRIRRHRCLWAYYSNTSASFHPFLIGDLVFKLNPGPKGIPLIVSTRSNYNGETQPSSLLQNISNLISVHRLYALVPIVTHQHLSLCLLNACSVKNKTADLFDYICDCKADLVAITENWLTIDEDAVRAELCPVGYKISDCPRRVVALAESAWYTGNRYLTDGLTLAGKNPLNTLNGLSHHLHLIFGSSFFIVHLIRLITESQLMISSRSSPLTLKPYFSQKSL